MMIGAKDRSYYRLEDTRDLLEEAKYNPSTELCIVLGERLYEADQKIAKLEEKNHNGYYFD